MTTQTKRPTPTTSPSGGPVQKTIETADGRMAVRATIIKEVGTGSTNTNSNALDAFTGDYSMHDILAPAHNPLTLASTVEISAPLKQCIGVKRVNVVGFGYDMVRLRKYKKEEDMPPEAKVERQKLTRFFDHVNRKEDWVKLMDKVWDDHESVGAGYLEVVRNVGGEIDSLHYLPAWTMRKTKKDKTWTEFEQPVRSEDGKFEMVRRKERFRRFVQRMQGPNVRKVYFKEFGDPREISAHTGKPLSEDGDEGTQKSTNLLANEVIAFEQHCSYQTYGQPRWLPNMVNIMGSRSADEVNYLFFGNKTIPPLMITVSGGSLTKDTVKTLVDVWEKEVKGVQNFHKCIILEATPADIGMIEGEKISPVKIEVKPLTQFIESDAQFLKYSERNEASVRADFKLPGIYFGMEKSYNRATAIEAARVVEEQVFGPERTSIAYTINTTIMADMQIANWTFELLGAKTSDWAVILKSIASVKEAVPIGIILKVINKMLNEPVEDIPEALYDTFLAQMQTAATTLPPGDEKDVAESALEKLIDFQEEASKLAKTAKVPVGA